MPATIEQKTKFIKDTSAIFLSIENQFGIKSNISLTQAAHESNWGISQLAIEGKNIFSITPGSSWISAINSGDVAIKNIPTWSSLGRPVIYFPTTEYSKLPPEKIRYWEIQGDITEKRNDGNGGSILTVKRYFRQYSNWAESAWDWARKIAKSERYKDAYEVSKTGAVDVYGLEMVKAGYATDPEYAKGLDKTAIAIAKLGVV